MEFLLTGTESAARLERFMPRWFARDALELSMEALKDDAVLRLEDDDTDANGRPFEPWSDDYADTRSGSDKFLYSSGDLADSLEVRAKGDRAEIVSDVPYAGVHQTGGGNTPQRQYAGANPGAESAVEDLLRRDLSRKWGLIV